MSWGEGSRGNSASASSSPSRWAGRRTSSGSMMGGKLTVRERIERLLDAGDVSRVRRSGRVAPKYEGELLASIMPAKTLSEALGRINGRRVVVGGDDFHGARRCGGTRISANKRQLRRADRA